MSNEAVISTQEDIVLIALNFNRLTTTPTWSYVFPRENLPVYIILSGGSRAAFLREFVARSTNFTSSAKATSCVARVLRFCSCAADQKIERRDYVRFIGHNMKERSYVPTLNDTVEGQPQGNGFGGTRSSYRAALPRYSKEHVKVRHAS